jgi:hypothetical protein
MTLDWPEEDAKVEGKTRVRLEDDYGLRLSGAPGTSKPAAAEQRQTEATQPAE